MNQAIIQIENLGKKFMLSQEAKVGSYTSLRDVIQNKFASIFNTNKKANQDEFWAIRELDLEIKQGEIVGIIGRNGAGKSTLLKLISRIIEPTNGKITLHGRAASLLEVGTGFHPELTGRENIFLNGAILGMSRREIKNKFDEIVDFSDVAKFLDTPVKHYSSGMYVRLAFAVAAHLEPEILIVDEVLAVGDAEFQKKCLGKMEEITKKQGRTVLFVSHNLGAVQNLCSRVLVLNQGTLYAEGNTAKMIQSYLSLSEAQSGLMYVGHNKGKKIWFKKIQLASSVGSTKNEFFHDEPLCVKYELEFNIPKTAHDYKVFVLVLDHYKNRIFGLESPIVETEKLSVEIPPNTLVRGNYSLHTYVHKPQTEQIDVAEDVCHFTVIDNGSSLNVQGNYDYGRVFVNGVWK